MSLISTADLRAWMGIEAGDKTPNTKLELITFAVQDFCDNYVGYELEAKRYLTDPQFSYLDGNGLPYVYLPRHPVSYVSSVNVDSDRTFAAGTLIASADIYWYPSGKVVSEGGYFTRGRRNVLIDYTAGYAPVVNNTYNSAVSTYPIPRDLKQVMIEMTVESYKEGITAVHSVPSGNPGEMKLHMMLNSNTFWRATLDKYKDYANTLLGRWE